MNDVSLDKFDLRILEILQSDGRISNLDLAEMVGLSATPCSRRVKRLEAAGVIEGYTARISPLAIGLDVSVFISVRLEKKASGPAVNFADVVQDIPEIFECYLVTGDYDYVLRVRTRGVDSLKDFILNKLTAIPGVAETSSTLILEETKVF
ncbi:MAG: Lrp/AsnC family transcriptional regulator [Pseudomonadota bacterium]|nr:Lrp/AsnC family transcriptional regulator [Pseudomonadota bacterium]